MGILDPEDIDKYANQKLKFLPLFILFVGTITLTAVAANQYFFKNWSLSDTKEETPTPTEVLTDPGEVKGEDIEVISTPPETPTPTKFIKPAATKVPTKIPTAAPTTTPTNTPTPTVTVTPTSIVTSTIIPTPTDSLIPTATPSGTISPTP